jgi:hypothetical protein
VALGSVHDTRGHESFSSLMAWRFAVDRGMVVEGRSYPTWPEALSAAGIPPGELMKVPAHPDLPLQA